MMALKDIATALFYVATSMVCGVVIFAIGYAVYKSVIDAIKKKDKE
jgi:hypothetical protein